jgi:hypothetical protein
MTLIAKTNEVKTPAEIRWEEELNKLLETAKTRGIFIGSFVTWCGFVVAILIINLYIK